MNEDKADPSSPLPTPPCSNRATPAWAALLLSSLVATSPVFADDPVRLTEKAAVGSVFRVTSNSTINGELQTPAEKDKPSERVKIGGRSAIDYAERILAVDAKDAEHKTLRIYENIDFRKTAGDRTEEMTLRPAVRRLVLMKKGMAKVPFSPDAPLMWGEIDLLRTDLLVPALAGLLPNNDVKNGDSWKATAAAVAELTDLEKIDKGEVTCTLEKVESLGPRQVAHVRLAGTLDGINEDGPTRQNLTGRLQVDVGAQYISFLRIDGEHYLLDDKGKEAGKITGTFELTRSPLSGLAALSDTAVKGLDVNPSEENTRLLYDNEETGVRFVHSRNWRVVRSTGRQITLDESDGSGLLITLDTAAGLPAPAQYLQEAIKEMQGRGAKLLDRNGPERLANGLDRFTLEAQEGKEKVSMDYFVIRQEKGGATFAARLPAAQRDARKKELERLARSFVVTRRLDGK
jgi:hypothetical protein